MLGFFFFQAEDGIRDGHVTGVQTCALPIFSCSRVMIVTESRKRPSSLAAGLSCSPGPFHQETRRSEERRVGKECRARRERDVYKKKTRMQSKRTQREKQHAEGQQTSDSKRT